MVTVLEDNIVGSCRSNQTTGLALFSRIRQEVGRRLHAPKTTHSCPLDLVASACMHTKKRKRAGSAESNLEAGKSREPEVLGRGDYRRCGTWTYWRVSRQEDAALAGAGPDPCESGRTASNPERIQRRSEAASGAEVSASASCSLSCSGRGFLSPKHPSYNRSHMYRSAKVCALTHASWRRFLPPLQSLVFRTGVIDTLEALPKAISSCVQSNASPSHLSSTGMP